jgi:hypothetical protein
MDILEYTRQFCSGLQLAKKTKYQFGVLAFDLGEIGPDPHPPKFECVTAANFKIGAAGPSGPWIVQNQHWTPVMTLAVDKDGNYAREKKSGDYRVGSHAESGETICSERWLLGGLSGYLKPYFKEYGRLPLSVSLYSVMTPCSRCNAYMRRYPGSKHTILGEQTVGTVGRWYFAYSQNYPAEYFDDAAGDRATAELGSSGWNISKG